MARVRVSYLAAGVALAVVGVYLAAVNGATWQGALASRGWASTTGEVVSSDVVVVVNEAGETQSYGARVVYTYLVSGRRHESNRVSFGRGLLREGGEVTALVERYPEGARVRVYYDPRAPRESVLEPGVTGPLFLVMGAAAGAIVVGAIVGMRGIKGILGGRNEEREDERDSGDDSSGDSGDGWQGSTREV